MSGIGKNQSPGCPNDWQESKKQVLTKKTSSTARSIAHAVVLKDESLFVVAQQDAIIPFEGAHGFGLYHHDCRFLNGYVLTLAGSDLELLGSNARSGHEAIFELTNHEIVTPNGKKVDKNNLAIRIQRAVDGRSLAMADEITIRNYSLEDAVDLPIELAFRSEFEDVYVVRGIGPDVHGELDPPAWHDRALILSYRGKDDVVRTTTITFSHPIASHEDTLARFTLHLPPGASETMTIEVTVAENRLGTTPAVNKADIAGTHRRIQQNAAAFRDERAHVRTKDQVLEHVLEQSFADLLMLRTPQDAEVYFAAGVPWFTTLFGRDSLITALFVLPYHATIAEHTLRLLAKHQGRTVDAWRDEEPGKILHEFRIGELANLNRIPDTPYYGTIDATALFLILLARHAAWTGRLDLFHELRANADAALEWLVRYGERPQLEGYVSYASEAGDLLINQGWKDSGDAIVDENAHVVRPPIALVEVQGYSYLAKREMADLYERIGERETAERLRREAQELRRRFNRDFWLPDKDFYALALASGGKPVRVHSSNPGHALFAGIADDDKAEKTVRGFMSDEMFSGWGVRTLASNEKGYNPVSYHRGTVWPHDNALIVSGLHRYGFGEEAARMTAGMIDAATHFPLHRLPEVFSGFPREGYGMPVRYPVACHPQAWASGSIPFMISSILGLEPEGFDGRLRINRPVLPLPVEYLEISGLAVGQGKVDLAFERTDQGGTHVRVLRTEGAIEIVHDAG